MKEYEDNKLYNKRAFGLPEFEINIRRVHLRYTHHARARLEQYNRDSSIGKQDVVAPRSINFKELDIVEMETTPEDEPVKIVGRYAIDQERDLVLIILLEKMIVKTMWVNVNCDQHYSLNKKGYDKP